MPKKLTQEEATIKNPQNGPFLIGKYTNTRIKTEFQCSCGKIFLAKPNSIWNGSYGCLQKIITKTTRYKQSIIRWKGTQDISKTYFSRLKQGAKHRKKEFDITIEYLQKLLEKQGYKCALTGLPIKCTRNVNKHSESYEEQTASLDRIDNTQGYIKDNLQWIHKDINNMKHMLSEHKFIKYCELVYKYKGDKS